MTLTLCTPCRCLLQMPFSLRYVTTSSDCVYKQLKLTSSSFLYTAQRPSVFAKRVKLDHLQLPSEGVCVLWKWDICTFSESEELDTSKEFESENDEKDTKSDTQTDEEAAAVPITHTVTFKCIGTTKTDESRETLKAVSELLAMCLLTYFPSHRIPMIHAPLLSKPL